MSLNKLFLTIFSVFVFLLAGLALVAGTMMFNENALNQAQQIRYESYLAADELRKSSMDLTRLARTYVATGDPKYEAMYWEVLDIRAGKKPRPDGRTIALKKIMEDLGFTAAEFSLLDKAASNSDGLVWTETVAINAMKGLFADTNRQFTMKGDPDPQMARELMFNAQYHQYVSEIMQPVDEFFKMLDSRTKTTVDRYIEISKLLTWIAIAVVALLIVASICSYLLICRKVRD